MKETGDVVFVGDVHLERDDRDLAEFVAFVERSARSASRIVLVGDLFDLWVGLRDMEGPQHRTVTECFERLRARGTTLRYIEGNRDYAIRARYTGTAFDDVAEGGIEESAGGRRIFAIHGDLVNESDRQYRRWRKLSRSRPFWWTFRSLPARVRHRLSQSLESSMRSSNQGFKRAFPEESVRRYAAGLLARGYDAVVLGHFHVEKELDGRIFVLPEWRESRRHLRVDASTGRIAFESS